MPLQDRIESAVAAGDSADRSKALAAFVALRRALELGTIRAASRDENDRWVVNDWVKAGILLGFRLGSVADLSVGAMSFFDKDTFPPRAFDATDGVRIVPGGTAIRSGAYVANTVVCMPPSYVNVGAYIGAGTMIDSHVLVGSCAQIGERVHLSTAVQIGGVLEPVGALPVIVEDDVFVGGGCGIYEGCIVGKEAVLAPGVILTRSTSLIDLVNERMIAPGPDGSLQVPQGAVVVPGSRPASGSFAHNNRIALYAPVIVKYRDASTSASTALEQALR
ncbi:MAG: 2,3,4,5-tetrahydropyridine-2,6-dicarboxylate N-succinyltransferase [Rhodothermales bacterium]|nr:2,3,4,5-tetrahydropyridine-2,6-dicarboxylate N-succinyltransferase [Rhodothermales bacterium]